MEHGARLRVHNGVDGLSVKLSYLLSVFNSREGSGDSSGATKVLGEIFKVRSEIERLSAPRQKSVHDFDTQVVA